MSWAAVLGAIAGAALTAGGEVFGNYWLQQQQNIQNIQQWERENEYNKPAAQMQRLREAGLNPNLVYGRGSVANTAASSPHLGRSDVRFGQLGQYVQLMIADAQRENIVAQNQLIRAQTEEVEGRIRGQRAEVWQKERENRILADSDLSGYMVSRDDPAWIRLMLKGMHSPAWSRLGRTVQKIMNYWQYEDDLTKNWRRE